MPNLTRRTQLIALAVGGVVVLVAVGAALAYWTGTGSGSGAATVGTSGSVTLTAAVTDGIAPGLSVPVSFTAANPGDSAIQVTTVHLASVAADAEHGSCVTADFTMEDVTQNHEVPAGATAEDLPSDGTLVYANTAVSQDACKGATLTLTLTGV